MNKPKEYWIDSARDDFNKMKATDCIQTHEDTLVGNSIRVIEYSAYQELLDQINSIPEHHWRDIAAQNILLEQKLNKAIEALEEAAEYYNVNGEAGYIWKALKEIKGE